MIAYWLWFWAFQDRERFWWASFIFDSLCFGCGSSSFVLKLCLQNFLDVRKNLMCWSTSKILVVVFAAEQVLMAFVAETCLLWCPNTKKSWSAYVLLLRLRLVYLHLTLISGLSITDCGVKWGEVCSTTKSICSFGSSNDRAILFFGFFCLCLPIKEIKMMCCVCVCVGGGGLIA